MAAVLPEPRVCPECEWWSERVNGTRRLHVAEVHGRHDAAVAFVQAWHDAPNFPDVATRLEWTIKMSVWAGLILQNQAYPPVTVTGVKR
jgi:hypothetical protein